MDEPGSFAVGGAALASALHHLGREIDADQADTAFEQPTTDEPGATPGVEHAAAAREASVLHQALDRGGIALNGGPLELRGLCVKSLGKPAIVVVHSKLPKAACNPTKTRRRGG